MNEFFALLGLKVSALVAGLVGGIISLTFETKLSFMRALLLILTGAVCAGYLMPLIEVKLGLSSKLANSMAFIVGLISMRIVRGILVFADAFKDRPLDLLKIFRNGNSKDDA